MLAIKYMCMYAFLKNTCTCINLLFILENKVHSNFLAIMSIFLEMGGEVANEVSLTISLPSIIS
jgi:hypothetical protein